MRSLLLHVRNVRKKEGKYVVRNVSAHFRETKEKLSSNLAALWANDREMLGNPKIGLHNLLIYSVGIAHGTEFRNDNLESVRNGAKK